MLSRLLENGKSNGESLDVRKRQLNYSESDGLFVFTNVQKLSLNSFNIFYQYLIIRRRFFQCKNVKLAHLSLV